MDEAREFWVSPPLDVNERLSSLIGLGGSAFPASANLLISSSLNSGISGGGECGLTEALAGTGIRTAQGKGEAVGERC